MRHIDEERLENDNSYRFEYLADFMGFSAEDISAIHGSADFLAPLVPQLVDQVYEKLQAQDATWRHFLPRQHGYLGEIPNKLEDLKADHPQISFRKQHLARYLERLVTAPYNESMVKYLDMVGKIHTHWAGNPDIYIPNVQMNALMGFVSDAINKTILESTLDFVIKTKAIRAFGKLLWLQNDFIQKHYSQKTPNH